MGFNYLRLGARAKTDLAYKGITDWVNKYIESVSFI